MGSNRRNGLIAVTATAALLVVQTLAPAQNPPPDTQARQFPASRTGLGEVSLRIQTVLPENQERFARGVAFLHGHASLQAEREFMQIVATEKDPPMAYWGLAWALFDEPDRAADFIERGVLYLDKATPAERRWIEALAAFYEVRASTAAAHQAAREKAGPTEAVRRRTFRRPRAARARALLAAHTALADAAPADPAANGFLVDLAVRFRAFEARSKIDLDRRLRTALAGKPRHAARYHLMELWRFADPKRARKIALTVGTATPAVATQWLLAGRVLDGCGEPDTAASMFGRAMRLAHRDMARYRLMPFRVAHYPEILWLRARALIRAGRTQAALDLAARAEAMPRHPVYNQLGNPEHLAGLAPRIRVAVCAMEPDAAKLAKIQTDAEATMAAHRFGRVTLAADLASTYLEAGDLQRSAPLVQAVRDARADAWPRPQAALLDAWIRRHEARTRWARDVVSVRPGGFPSEGRMATWRPPPPQDNSLDFYFDVRGSAVEFARTIRDAAAESSNRRAFAALAAAAPRADLRNPAFAHLPPIAKALGLPADWRTLARPPIPPADDTFGPAQWQPFSAEDGLLKRLNGKPVALTEYRGKPHVVIQYLGFGCLHCVEQLRKFHPHVTAYRKAGLDILAIGTDTPKNMREAIVDLPPSEKLAYTMLSDRKMRTFRSFRAYDFFRHLPLHGTYLVDAQGRILWQDISWQPFEEPRWFLEECRRLLSPSPR